MADASTPDEQWITVKRASIMIGVHDRTIRRYIREGKLEAKKEGRRVLINIDSVNDLITADHRQDHIEDHIDHTQDHIEDHIGNAGSEAVLLRDQLRRQEEEVQFLRDRIKQLAAERDQERARDQTIILQLTRQLEQSQRLLEYQQEPWYRKLFRRKSGPE